MITYFIDPSFLRLQTCDEIYTNKATSNAYIMLMDLCSIVRARLSLMSIYRDMVAASDATVVNFQESIIDRLSSIFPNGQMCFLSFSRGSVHEAASSSTILSVPPIPSSAGIVSQGKEKEKEDTSVLAHCRSLCSMVLHEVRQQLLKHVSLFLTSLLTNYLNLNLNLNLCYPPPGDDIEDVL